MTVTKDQKEQTPKEIVELLNRYVIGQNDAKRCVAIALRNRWRRMQVPEDLREEIMPKNIIMIGPTGVGKTEIARRIAKLVNAPFVKVEASKFTEIGYVGRDVESMIRDLIESAVNIVRHEKIHEVEEKAKEMAKDRVLDLLIPPTKISEENKEHIEEFRDDQEIRNKFAKKLDDGLLDDKVVEINMSDRPSGSHIEFFPITGSESMDLNLKDMISNIMPKQSKQKKVPIKDALKILAQEESEKLIDMDDVKQIAIKKVEQNGIVFLDEIDKIATNANQSHSGGDISREGVQRDLLPIVEGSTVNTKYGQVKTDHILFIASGAFHVAKPSDLIPELQGRFPIRVELSSLSKEDFIKILTEPDNSLTRQYIELMKTEGINLIFNPQAIEEIAEIAYEVNSKMENIGARRLHTILEKLLDEISFNAPDLQGQDVEITSNYVKEKLTDVSRNQDLSRYVL